MPTPTATLPDSIAMTPVSHRGAHRWLLFVHQLPASPSNLRVRTWRRLQQIGAAPVKQAVYVLPNTPAAREDFEWLTTEVKGAGGDASVFAADSVDAFSDDALVEEFRRARQEAYGALAREIERVLSRMNITRRPRGTRAPAVHRLVEVFRGRLSALERIDFFGSAGRDRVISLVAQLEERARPASTSKGVASAAGFADVTSYRRRVWVTRPRPGVDRMGSAWLIRRFVDPEARFGFAVDRNSLPEGDTIPFDMFGVEFTHRGEDCTFETLCSHLRHPGSRGGPHCRDRSRPRPQGWPLRRIRRDDHWRPDRRTPTGDGRRRDFARTRDHALRIAVPCLRAVGPSSGPTTRGEAFRSHTGDGAVQPDHSSATVALRIPEVRDVIGHLATTAWYSVIA